MFCDREHPSGKGFKSFDENGPTPPSDKATFNSLQKFTLGANPIPRESTTQGPSTHAHAPSTGVCKKYSCKARWREGDKCFFGRFFVHADRLLSAPAGSQASAYSTHFRCLLLLNDGRGAPSVAMKMWGDTPTYILFLYTVSCKIGMPYEQKIC